MATTQQAEALRGSEKGVFTTKRRQAGTSLVEILVVIVIFLIGILAVVQVFPRGFRLLLVSRSNSVATALGRDEVERIKAKPEGIPEEVVTVQYVGGVPMVNQTRDPLDVSPLGDAIDAQGVLYAGGQKVADNWMLAAGPNIARHIVGEGSRVPGPRVVGNNANGGAIYGGAMVLEHGPIDATTPLVVYANDLSRVAGPPREAAGGVVAYVPADSSKTVQAFSPDGRTARGAVTAYNVTTPVTLDAYTYFAVNASTPNASVLLPTSLYDRYYRVRFSGYAGNGSGFARTDWVSLCVFVPAKAAGDPTPLVQVPLGALLTSSGALAAGNTLGAVEVDTLRVAPLYAPVALPMSAFDQARWPVDPFLVAVTDPVLGSLVFSPAARQTTVQRAGGLSEPLLAKVDYDVYDWRVLREDFRATGSGDSFDLAVQGIKVGSQTGPDGRVNSGIWTGSNPYDPSPATASDGSYPRDNLVLIDLTTGFQVQEYDTNLQSNGRTVADVSTGFASYDPAKALVSVDKSRGVVTLKGDVQGKIHLIVPAALGGGVLLVSPANRTLRVLYKARNEWSVQPIKAASQYTRVNSAPVLSGNYLIGDGAGNGDKGRIYFPASDIGRKVTIDRLVYRTGGGVVKTVEGQDFLIQKPRVTDPSTLGYVSVADLVGDPNAQFDRLSGLDPVQGVKGASLAVRVLWNPETFQLGTNSQENITRLEQWGRSWRRSTTETYLRAEETR